MPPLFAILGSAVAYIALYPPYALSSLAFVALMPLCWVLRSANARHAAGSAGLWGLLTTAGLVAWLVPTARDYFGLSMAPALAFLLLVAALSAAPHLAIVYGVLGARRLRSAALWPLLFALGWVASEWLRTKTGIESPWGRLGDSQHDAPRLRQVADLCGVYGLSFLLALCNALLTELACVAFERGRDRRQDVRALAPTAIGLSILLVGALVYGTAQQERWSGAERDLDIVLIQGNVSQELRWSRTRASQVLRRYVRLTRDALRDSDRTNAMPDLVIWPENAIQTSLDHPVYGPTTRRLARDMGLPLLLGAPRSEETDGLTHHYNSALMLSPDGRVEHYDKRRLLLFSERNVLPHRGSAPDGPVYSAGTQPGIFSLADGPIATLICMEALYPALAREAASQDAVLIVNLSNDGWFRGRGAGQQHLAQVRFRAIETRRSMVRATTSGISALIGPDGRIESSLEQGEEGWLRASIPAVRQQRTIYTRTGDLLPVTALLMCISAVFPWQRIRTRT